MTTSILLRIVMLDSKNHYIKKLTKVKPKIKKYTICCPLSLNAQRLN